LLVDDDTLLHKSEILSQLADEIASDFKEKSIEQNFTVSSQKALAGITID
jgi:hydroxymethylpyrimidine pyrophosphatase-like HAD family hydrolase